MSAVLDFDPERRTNAQAIADLARLGILRSEDRVLDATIGPLRAFWSLWQPRVLVTNDLEAMVPADTHWDARHLPLPDRTFDVVVFDPPYANRGTSRLEMDKSYGLGVYRTRADVEGLLCDGTSEALRVADRLAIVKCQDACVSGKFAPQSYLVWETATTQGAKLVAQLYVVGRREQPNGKRQKNVWTACSTMMVFAR